MPNDVGSTPFGDISSPKHRHRSEPPSLSACAKAILLGPAHPTHELHDGTVKTTQAAASLMMSADEVYRYTEDTAVHKFHYPLPKLIVLGILAGPLEAEGGADDGWLHGCMQEHGCISVLILSAQCC